jgi:hypothetical protein
VVGGSLVRGGRVIAVAIVAVVVQRIYYSAKPINRDRNRLLTALADAWLKATCIYNVIDNNRSHRSTERGAT